MQIFLLKKQEQILDSFINVQQYDKLLFYLESSLFCTAPVLICPSSFIIKILLTLATLGDYANVDIIRKEFGNPLSERPFYKRALDILIKLVTIVKEKNPISDNPFDPPGYDSEDIEYAETQLINSLDFLIDDIKIKKLRTIIKKNYKEKKFMKEYKNQKDKDIKSFLNSYNNDITSKPIKKSKIQKEELEWSPQRRQMEREFIRLKEDNVDLYLDKESDDELENTAGYKSLKIFKNNRIDIALNESNIWNLISWALKCSLNDNDPISREIWNVWRPLLDVVIDILELESDKFMIKKKQDKKMIFKETLSQKFLFKVGGYDWSKKISEFILIEKSSKIIPIYNNETTCAKSVLLGNSINYNSDSTFVTSESGELQRKLLFLACKVQEFMNHEYSISKVRYLKCENICSNFIKIFIRGSYSDLINFFKLNKKTLETPWKINIIKELLIMYLIELTTYEFNQPSSHWIHEASSLKFLKDLFEHVTYKKRFYDFDSKLILEKMKIDYNKINIILYELFKVWLTFSKYELSIDEKEELLELARLGEKTRLSVVIESAQVGNNLDMDNLKFLSTWLQKDFHQSCIQKKTKKNKKKKKKQKKKQSYKALV